MPSLAGVSRLIDSVALHDVPAKLGLAHADVNDVWIRFGDPYCTDGRAAQLTVGDRLPCSAAIHGFPKTAPDRTEVVFERASYGTRTGERAAASIGANATPF